MQNEVLLSDGRKGQIVLINKSMVSKPIVQCGGEVIDLSKSLTYILKISCRFLFLKCQIKVLDKKTDVVYDIHCAKYLSRSELWNGLIKKLCYMIFMENF